jgi:hypothetical protein
LLVEPPVRHLTFEGMVDHRLEIALRLGHGELGAGYVEAFVLMSSALSAMAATAWPGLGIDAVVARWVAGRAKLVSSR